MESETAKAHQQEDEVGGHKMNNYSRPGILEGEDIVLEQSNRRLVPLL